MRSYQQNRLLEFETDDEAIFRFKKYFGRFDKDVCKHLNVSRSWLNYYRKNNTMPLEKRLEINKLIKNEQALIEKALQSRDSKK
jgi:hypothetical protein